MFKVVADQLKVSAGWVRCGHCAEVFDARLNMQQQTPEPTPGQGFAQTEFAAQPWTDAGPGAPPTAMEYLPPQAQPDVMLDPPANVVARPMARVMHKPNVGAPAPSLREFGDLAFMRQARREAVWRLPSVRAGLGLLALLLLSVLTLQVTLDQRDRLAALEPDAKPWLEALCGQLGCVVSPLRQLDSLVIDGSSFNKMTPNLYRLAFAVKNGGALDVATPFVELTLTDTQDQTLARRVLHPDELGSPGASIRPGAEWTGTAVLRLAPDVGDVAGYRILVFYP